MIGWPAQLRDSCRHFGAPAGLSSHFVQSKLLAISRSTMKQAWRTRLEEICMIFNHGLVPQRISTVVGILRDHDLPLPHTLKPIKLNKPAEIRVFHINQ